MALKTAITQILRIKHPIIQGGMNFAGSPELSAAVANGGGLGLVTAMRHPSVSEFRTEICAARSMLHPSCTGELGVNLTILPMYREQICYDAYVDAILDENISVVETSGLVPSEFIQRLKQNDVKVIHKCVKISEALKAEEIGVDIVALDGFECAGQPKEEDIGNWVLQALGSRHISVPYVVSGGVGNGRQLAAALALGASGVTMGTRFMATKESALNDGMKQQLVERGTGNAALALHPNGQAVDPRPHGVKLSIWSCGPVMALIEDIPSCEQLMERMVSEAIDVIEALPAEVLSS